MISRLTAFAVLFAVVTAASLAYAATVQQQHRAAIAAMPVVELPAVQIVAHRSR